MCTISRRFFVSNTKYSVWLFMLPSATQHLHKPAAQLKTGFSFILKPAVNASHTADSLAQRGQDLLAEGRAAEAADAFRAAIAADPAHVEAHHGLVRALRDVGELDQSVGAAIALTVLTPDDPLAHTALSIALQRAGQISQAEAAAARARILEWKRELQSPRGQDSLQ
jgi:tetratricopeptide (TPR) repeat protein